MTIQILVFLFLIIISNFITFKFFSIKFNKKMDELKDKSIQLKFIIEDSIKDRKIDSDEYNKLREAVLDLEEKILE